MSSTAVSGHIVVLGPPPAQRLHSLLTVPGVLVDELEAYWQSGVSMLGYPNVVPGLWEGCSSGTFRTKAEAEPRPTATFTTFVMYVPVGCSALGVGDFEEFKDQARLVLLASQAFAVERALAQGVVGLDNPYLGDANLDVLAGGAAVSAKEGISYLDEYIGDRGRGGMIHITPAVADALSPMHMVDDPTKPLYTTAGTSIAVGA